MGEFAYVLYEYYVLLIMHESITPPLFRAAPRGLAVRVQACLRASAVRRRMGATLLMLLLLLLTLTLELRGVPTALPAEVGGEGESGPLLPCGTSGGSDPGGDSRQVLDVFQVVKGVCAQRGEACPAGHILPISCGSAECQRAVRLAADSCSPTFAKDGFLKSAFGSYLDAAVAVCDAAPHSADAQVWAREALRLAPRYIAADSRCAACTSQRHAITGHATVSQALVLQAQGGGRLTDGMGTGGHNASFNGQDYAVVQAAAGQLAQLDLRVLWLSQRNNVRVTVDGGEETLLQGTELPPPGEGGGRRFRSKVGGTIQVLLLVTDDPGSLSFVSLAVSAACLDAQGCGGHGQCIGGNCTCADGYSGMGTMRVLVEPALLHFGAAACD